MLCEDLRIKSCYANVKFFPKTDNLFTNILSKSKNSTSNFECHHYCMPMPRLRNKIEETKCI